MLQIKSTPMGSLDTIGEKSGHDILPHVKACLGHDGLSAEEAEKVASVPIEPRDATGVWCEPHTRCSMGFLPHHLCGL